MVKLNRTVAGNAETMLAVMLFVVVLVVAVNLTVKTDGFREHSNYVHTYVEPQGNWTYMEKPMFPILFNESEIGIGENWSIVCPVSANHTYHVYCYGKWVDNGSEPKTDYDIYVNDPTGEMEGYHTESAGLPEHLGTTVDEPFFAPKFSGNYTFVVRNDPRESNGTQQATFMIVEDVDCNVWHEHCVEGKESGNLPVLNTSWAYEFVTEGQYVEVWVKVPESLDMYEARLYLMADSKSQNYTLLNDVPLAWEPGLYGERNGTVGGYNLESEEYRGVAYASCEHYGQEMFLNWTNSHVGKSLYHLVLIGEVGNGTVEFLVKTEFGKARLKPVTVAYRVYPQNETAIEYASETTDLVNATLQYSVDNWKNTTSIDMEILENKTSRAVIPGQNASTFVAYRVEANDVLKNILAANGSFWVKQPTALDLTLVNKVVHIGENITVRGNFTPNTESIPITVYFNSANATKKIECLTLVDGSFSVSFQTEDLAAWEIQARFNGTGSYYPCSSESLTIKVEEPTFLMRYSLYIGGGAATTAVIGAVVYVKKFKH